MNTTFQTGLAYAKELDTKVSSTNIVKIFLFNQEKSIWIELFRYGF